MVRWTIRSGHTYLRVIYVPEQDIWISTRARILKMHNSRWRRTDKVITTMTLQEVVNALTVGKPIKYKYDSSNQAKIDVQDYGEEHKSNF